MKRAYICRGCLERLYYTSKYQTGFTRRPFVSLSVSDAEDPLKTDDRKSHRTKPIDQSDGKGRPEPEFASFSQQLEKIFIKPPVHLDLPRTTRYSNKPLPAASSEPGFNPNPDCPADLQQKLERLINTIHSLPDTRSEALEILNEVSSFNRGSVTRCVRSSHNPKRYYRAFAQLLSDVIEADVHGDISRKVVHTLVGQYVHIKVMDGRWWHCALWRYIEELLQKLDIIQLPSATPGSNVHASYLVEQLSQVWHRYLQESIRSRQPVASSEAAKLYRDFVSLFFNTFGAGAPHTAFHNSEVPALAAMTYFVVDMVKRESTNNIPRLQQSFSEFLDCVGFCVHSTAPDLQLFREQLLAGCTFPFMSRNPSFVLSPDVYESVNGRWKNMYEALRLSREDELANVITVPLGAIQRSKGVLEDLKSALDIGTINGLKTAARRHDTGYALTTWRRIQPTLAQREGQGIGDLSVEVLNCFIALGEQDRAIEAWNKMQQSKMKIDYRHWTAMLNCAQRRKDFHSMEQIWQEMRSHSDMLTNTAWTTYLKGLCQNYKWRSVMQTLTDLGKWWDSIPSVPAVSKNFPLQDDELIPSIVPINAAIYGLMWLGRHGAAESVWKWAKSRNLEPTTDTYNSLLRRSFRSSDNGSISKILAEMEMSKCAPDAVTVTTLLDGLYRSPGSSFASSTPEQQEEAIMRVFDGMRDAGIGPNQHIYSKILDSLLSGKWPNVDAARAILVRMHKQGIRPSTHANTIVITHYFKTTPPNLHAVDALWHQIQSSVSPQDHIFYDTLIEGYARHGSAEKLLGVLQYMAKDNKTPSWTSLNTTLNALNEAGERDLVRELVGDVSGKTGPIRLGTRASGDRLQGDRIRGRKGEAQFWDLVDSLRKEISDLPGRPEGSSS